MGDDERSAPAGAPSSGRQRTARSWMEELQEATRRRQARIKRAEISVVGAARSYLDAVARRAKLVKVGGPVELARLNDPVDAALARLAGAAIALGEADKE